MFSSLSTQAAILDLLANLSRDVGVAERIINMLNSVDAGKNFAETLLDHFWNKDHDSVSVILRHLIDDKKSLQSAMELEIIKSITKPPLGRDFKVALKTFGTAMKHIVERDYEVFQKAFARVAEVTPTGEVSASDRRFVVPKEILKELDSLPEVKPSKHLKTVVEMLFKTATASIVESAGTVRISAHERQAAAYRMLSELIEVHPSSVKFIMKLDADKMPSRIYCSSSFH